MTYNNSYKSYKIVKIWESIQKLHQTNFFKTKLKSLPLSYKRQSQSLFQDQTTTLKSNSSNKFYAAMT